MEWIFDGIGTAIIIFILGLATGGGIGYKAGINKNITNQRQKARDHASQTQIGRDNYD